MSAVVITVNPLFEVVLTVPLLVPANTSTALAFINTALGKVTAKLQFWFKYQCDTTINLYGVRSTSTRCVWLAPLTDVRATVSPTLPTLVDKADKSLFNG